MSIGGGTRVDRVAGLPQLTPQVSQLLQQFLQNPQAINAQFQPTSLLQQNLGNTFSQLLTGLAPGQQTGVAQGQINQALAPGQDVLAAAQPIFERNLQQQLSQQQAFGGPRFSQAAGQQAANLRQQSLQDFNLFSQQVLEQGRQRQLQQILGAGQLGIGLAGLQQEGNLATLLPLLQAAFQGGLPTPVVSQREGFNPLSAIAGGIGIASGLGSLGLFGGGGRTDTSGTPFTVPQGSRRITPFTPPTFGGPIRRRGGF